MRYFDNLLAAHCFGPPCTIHGSSETDGW